MARRSNGRAAAGGVAVIRPGDRVAIVGRSGTGKTTLLRELIRPHPRALALDPKRTLVLDGYEPLEGTRAAVSGWPTGWPRVVARPGLLEDATAWLDACCRRAYQVHHCALAIDELAGIANASSPPVWYDVIQTRGRELGITAITCTQRPRRIPATVLSEAEHVFAFDLSRPEDRATMAELMGYWRPANEHGFIYWRPTMVEPIECEPLAL